MLRALRAGLESATRIGPGFVRTALALPERGRRTMGSCNVRSEEGDASAACAFARTAPAIEGRLRMPDHDKVLCVQVFGLPQSGRDRAPRDRFSVVYARDGDSAPATTELSIVGEVRTSPVGDPGGTATAAFHRWGVWGGIPREDVATCTAIGCQPGGDTIFVAYLNDDMDGTVTASVDGNRSGTSPQYGSAVWAGDVLGYASEEAVSADGTPVTVYAAVRGDALLGANFEASTVDVDFHGFDDGRPDLSWDGLAMEAGAFGAEDGSIVGSFYGAAHEGAAGIFDCGGRRGSARERPQTGYGQCCSRRVRRRLNDVSTGSGPRRGPASRRALGP